MLHVPVVCTEQVSWQELRRRPGDARPAFEFSSDPFLPAPLLDNVCADHPWLTSFCWRTVPIIPGQHCGGAARRHAQQHPDGVQDCLHHAWYGSCCCDLYHPLTQLQARFLSDACGSAVPEVQKHLQRHPEVKQVALPDPIFSLMPHQLHYKLTLILSCRSSS